MDKKRSVTITITDLDDQEKVLEALGKLFNTIFTYYLTNEKGEHYYNLIMSCGVYFGSVLRASGVTQEDFKEKEDNE